MTAGQTAWHRQETTHYLGGGRYIVVRRTWDRCRWLVEESDGFGSRILDSADTRAEADVVAQMYAAIRPLHADGVA